MNNQQETILTQLYELVDIGVSFNESPLIKKELDKIFTPDVDLNYVYNLPISTVLFFAIEYASWDLFHYFLDKGARLNYKVDFKNHKQINCIDFAEILLQEIKNDILPDIAEDLKEIDRLKPVFENGVAEFEITMQEFYAFLTQADILTQVLFIEEFLKKYKYNY